MIISYQYIWLIYSFNLFGFGILLYLETMLSINNSFTYISFPIVTFPYACGFESHSYEGYDGIFSIAIVHSDTHCSFIWSYIKYCYVVNFNKKTSICILMKKENWTHCCDLFWPQRFSRHLNIFVCEAGFFFFVSPAC